MKFPLPLLRLFLLLKFQQQLLRLLKLPQMNHGPLLFRPKRPRWPPLLQYLKLLLLSFPQTKLRLPLLRLLRLPLSPLRQPKFLFLLLRPQQLRRPLLFLLLLLKHPPLSLPQLQRQPRLNR
jgi:hypothetical protein